MSINKHDTMRLHRSYITAQRKMRRLVRVCTAKVMLHRINNIHCP